MQAGAVRNALWGPLARYRRSSYLNNASMGVVPNAKALCPSCVGGKQCRGCDGSTEFFQWLLDAYGSPKTLTGPTVAYSDESFMSGADSSPGPTNDKYFNMVFWYVTLYYNAQQVLSAGDAADMRDFALGTFFENGILIWPSRAPNNYADTLLYHVMFNDLKPYESDTAAGNWVKPVVKPQWP